jgi:hypothetical protein
MKDLIVHLGIEKQRIQPAAWRPLPPFIQELIEAGENRMRRVRSGAWIAIYSSKIGLQN